MSQQPFEDPFWPRASAWLAGEFAEQSETAQARLAIVGAPVRRGSITPGRCDLTPQAVRALLRKFSCYDLETAADLRQLAVTDLGDLALAEATLAEAFAPLRDETARALKTGADAIVIIGGDNGVTRPGVHGMAEAYGLPLTACGLITLDAHFDLRDLGQGLTNGNPVRALLTDGLPGSHIAQIGLQPFANSQAYHVVAMENGIKVISMSQIRQGDFASLLGEALQQLSARVEAIYVDFDIDVLDRSFAPACPGSRPGGLTPWELKRAAYLCGTHPKVKAIDLVEVDPSQDVADTTVMTTAATLLAFAAGVLNRERVRQ